ncbi:MAG TPA: DMT family transporter [Candidatus Saccharimonadales bacterium]|nr:DMT family transporter [Candidatus Saccharimonadales bacterium]
MSRTVGADQHRLPPTLGVVAVLTAAALFGMLGPLARFAYDAGLEPASFVAWRAAIGLLALVAFVAWRVRRGTSRLIRPAMLSRRVKVTLLTAAVMGFLLNLCMFVAFDRVTIALALLGFYTYPAMVAVVNMVLGRERLDAVRATALAMALVGMVAVVASQLDPESGIRLDALGIGLALGAALSQTVYVVISRDGYQQVPTEQALVVVLAVTVLGATAIALIGSSPASLIEPIGSPSVIPLLLFTGIFSAAIPSLGFLAGIRSIGGTRAGILMLFEPVVGVALAAWLLDESLVPLQVAGAAAILAAAILLQRGTRTEGVGADGADDERAPALVSGGS